MTWTTRSSSTSGTGGTTDVTALDVTGRYVRVNMTSGTFTNYNIKELQVVGF